MVIWGDAWGEEGEKGVRRGSRGLMVLGGKEKGRGGRGGGACWQGGGK